MCFAYYIRKSCLGEILSKIVDPLSKSRERIWKAQSTEEVLQKIEENNTRLNEERVKEIMVGSLDVEALLP